jgi:hypothetical protein
VLGKLRALLTGRREDAPSTPSVAYHSRYGGLWPDRLDALSEIDRRLEGKRLAAADAELLRHWCAKGYVVLPQAVDPGACDRVRADIELAWREGDERLYILSSGSQHPHPLTAGSPTEGMRVVDAYAHLESARHALFAEPIVRFLSILFEDAPLLFQSLSFEQGSQQGMHQDTAYVVVSSPLELAASWIALQDVVEGTGELMYYEGSHRLPEYHFGSGTKHWDPSHPAAQQQHGEWASLLHQNSQRMGLPYRTFLPKKGDVLIWHADLAHGGSPPADPAVTRKSLVGHYCPRRCQPHYFSYLADRRTILPSGGGAYSSAHYAL